MNDQLTYDLRPTGLPVVAQANGSFEANRMDGRPLVHFQAPLAIDAAGNSSSTTLVLQSTGTALVQIPPTFLGAATYPVSLIPPPASLVGDDASADGPADVQVAADTPDLSAFGDNSYGQLGLGNTNSQTSPQLVPGFTGTVALAAGQDHSVVLRSDGTVWTFGSNYSGQLGNGTTSDESSPVEVVGSGGTGNLSGITAVAAGAYHTLALDSSGNVWAWGSGGAGQLGTGGTSDSSTPAQISGLSNIRAISASYDASFALDSNNNVWAWGDGWAGQTGQGTTNWSLTPVQVSGLPSNVQEVHAGGDFVLALMSDGTLWGWGWDGEGELATSASNSCTPSGGSPEPCAQTPISTGVTQVGALGAGEDHALAALYDGTLWAWGGNSAGQLGNNTWTDSQTPVQVLAPGGNGYLTDVTHLDGTRGYHSLVTANGNAFAWGWNGSGQLGDGTTTSQAIPEQVNGIPDHPSSIAGGGSHSLIDPNDQYTCGDPQGGHCRAHVQWNGSYIGSYTNITPNQASLDQGTNFLTHEMWLDDQGNSSCSLFQNVCWVELGVMTSGANNFYFTWQVYPGEQQSTEPDIVHIADVAQSDYSQAIQFQIAQSGSSTWDVSVSTSVGDYGEQWTGNSMSPNAIQQGQELSGTTSAWTDPFYFTNAGYINDQSMTVNYFTTMPSSSYRLGPPAFGWIDDPSSSFPGGEMESACC